MIATVILRATRCSEASPTPSARSPRASRDRWWRDLVDEFCVVLPERSLTDAEEFARAASRLLRAELGPNARSAGGPRLDPGARSA